MISITQKILRVSKNTKHVDFDDLFVFALLGGILLQLPKLSTSETGLFANRRLARSKRKLRLISCICSNRNPTEHINLYVLFLSKVENLLLQNSKANINQMMRQSHQSHQMIAWMTQPNIHWLLRLSHVKKKKKNENPIETQSSSRLLQQQSHCLRDVFCS